jgi:AmmeMemoRadiSam system protein B
MTHFEPASVAARLDELAIGRMQAVDPEGLHKVVVEKEISMCGCAPAVAILIACRDLVSTGS